MKANYWILIGAAGLGLAATFLRSGAPKPSETSVPSAQPAEAPAPAARVAGATTLDVLKDGVSTFLIDAPLEKIRGRVTATRGALQIDASDLTKTRGEIDFDLESLKTETFDDPDRNAAQTLHAHNWMEIGTETSPAVRDANRWARFTIDSIELPGAPKLGSGDVQSDGTILVHAVARGTLTVHGMAVPVAPRVLVTFGPSPSAGSKIRIQTEAPFQLSLKAHDIKPRDLAGKFLEGALEKVGGKIDDAVQVTVDVWAIGPRL